MRRYIAEATEIYDLLWTDPETETQAAQHDVGLPQRRFACVQPYFSLFFATDGQTSACCRDYDGEMPVGDLAERTPVEIWNGDALAGMRAGMLDPAGDQAALHPICASCNMWSTSAFYYSYEGDLTVRTEAAFRGYAKTKPMPTAGGAETPPAGFDERVRADVVAKLDRARR